MRQVTIMGVPFLYTTQQAFVSLLDERIQQREKTFVVTANPEIVMKAYDEPGFMEIIQHATYNIADGIGIVKASQLLRTPLPERVTGYDTMIKLLELANRKNYKVYFLGAKDDVLEQALTNIEEEYPNVQIVGSHHGYFDWDATTITDEIAQLKPDITFVALGVHLQERWISENIGAFDRGIFMGVGGSFDVLAGRVKRAPFSWQRLNLEWFYRFLQEPFRWKRLMALPRFAGKVMRQKFKGSS